MGELLHFPWAGLTLSRDREADEMVRGTISSGEHRELERTAARGPRLRGDASFSSSLRSQEKLGGWPARRPAMENEFHSF